MYGYDVITRELVNRGFEEMSSQKNVMKLCTSDLPIVAFQQYKYIFCDITIIPFTCCIFNHLISSCHEGATVYGRSSWKI